MGVKKEAENCWEFMGCSKEIRDNCEVYKLKAGRECWLLVDFKTGCPGAGKKYGNCMDCPWYKKLNPES